MCTCSAATGWDPLAFCARPPTHTTPLPSLRTTPQTLLAPHAHHHHKHLAHHRHNQHPNPRHTPPSLAQRYKWHVIRSVLKSVTGLQAGKLRELQVGRRGF